MKTKKLEIYALTLIAVLFLAACGAPTGGSNLNANVAIDSQAPLEFVGVIEEMNADTWVVNSLVVSIRADTELIGAFAVGDNVRLTMGTAQDGTLFVIAAEHAEADANGNGNENSNANDNANTNSNLNTNDNTNTNSNDNANANVNANDNDNGNGNGDD